MGRLRTHLWPVALLAAFLVVVSGCTTGAGNNPLAPVTLEKTASDTGSHYTWGLWQFTADPAAQTLDVIPLRHGNFHLNALHFLEPPPLVNLTLETLKFTGNIVDADIGLRHPFLGLTEFTGFDVCGILITNGSVTGFSDTGLRMAGAGDTRLLNPDGYSRWWNPAEFPHGGNISTYKDGLLGTPDSAADYNCTLNAYKYFSDELGANDPIDKVSYQKRGVFSGGQKNIRHYKIDMTAGLIFNYAVDACWKFPTGSKPWEVPDDFPPDANRPEAWNIKVTELTNTLWNDGSGNGGDLKLQVDVYDWYNASLNTINVDSPGNFPLATSSAPVGTGAGYSTYEIEILSATPAKDSISMLIGVESEDVGYGDLLPGKPITAYFMHTSAVAPEAPNPSFGWARTWGGTSADLGTDTAVDASGNSYTTGYFSEKVDFDPGAGEDIHASNGGYDVFLNKLDAAGNFIWARTWGGTGSDLGHGVTVDASGNVYVVGDFNGTVDFDPGSGVVNLISNGGNDGFLSKFDSTGAFLWARSWGGGSADNAWSVATDAAGTVCVTGYFNGTVDFDPGSGTDNHTSNGSVDVYLTKLDSSGAFLWARTWGGTSSDGGYGVGTDSTGNPYVTGYFYGTVDFDPGTGVNNQTAKGGTDIFLSKFDSSGNFLWARTWGGTSSEMSYDIAVDASGNSFVTGYFTGTVDFDPGTGIDNHTSNGGNDTYLSKLDSSGAFLWARTWGGTSQDFSQGVAADTSGNIYISGNFNETVDFDPGPGVDNHTSNGLYDIALSKLDAAGNFLWARTWGADSTVKDSGSGIASDVLNNVYITGWFGGTVDFDPGTGLDWHSSNGEAEVFLSKFLPDGSW